MSTPPPMPPSSQMMVDAQHLKLLAISHYIMAGLSCLGLLLGTLYAGMAIATVEAIGKMSHRVPSGSSSGHAASSGIPETFLWLFVGYGAFVSLVSLAAATGHFLTARYLSSRRHKVFCLGFAGISCLFVPLGTILGIFTIIVLCRPSVEALFRGGAALYAPRS